MRVLWIIFMLAVLMTAPVQVPADQGARHGGPGGGSGMRDQERVHSPMYDPDGAGDFAGRERDRDREHVPGELPGMRGSKRFNRIYVSTWEDPFVHPGRFAEVTGGMAFVDEDGDGIADIVQDTDLFAAGNFGEFIDENGDTIHDPFQTWEMHHTLGMRNFVDADGDGVCDNHVEGLGFRGHGFHRYEDLEMDLSDDVFIHPGRFAEATGGMAFVDENGDGIADIVQDTDLFYSFDFGEFVDENGDTIHDPFQSWEMYHALGMRNFVDADGDGVCDNYQVTDGE